MVTRFFRKSKKAKRTQRLRKKTIKPASPIYKNQFETIMSTKYNMDPDRREERMDTWNESLSHGDLKLLIKKTLFNEGQRDYFNVVDRFAKAYTMSHDRDEFKSKVLNQPKTILRVWLDNPDRFQRILWLDDALFWPDGTKRYHDDDVKISAALAALNTRLDPDNVMDFAELYKENAKADRRATAFAVEN
jgi:hypothetical protein